MSSDVAVELGDDAGEVSTADAGKSVHASTEGYLRQAAQALERIATALEKLAAARAQPSWRTRPGGVLAEALAEAARQRQDDDVRRWVESCANPATFTL